jgi:hypothetical protein
LEYGETHPMQIGVRYEYLDDDGMEQALKAWSVKDKLSIGGEYSFYKINKLIVYISAEMRHSRYRVHSSLYPFMHHKNIELYIKSGIDF